MHPNINYDKPPRKIRPNRRKDYDSERELDNIPRRCFCSSLSIANGEHDENCSLHHQDNGNNSEAASTLHQGAEILSKMFNCLSVEEQNDLEK